MKNKISITIGIPAHNEGLNIFNLVDSILSQKTENCIIENIILIYSGKDSVIIKEKIEKDYRGYSIVLFIDRDRTSKLDKLNRMFQLSKSEVTLILDADILIRDNILLDNLSKPFIDKSILITAPEIIPIPPTNLLQKILFLSHESKRSVSMLWNNGDNFISAIGRSMMYRTSFLKDITLGDTLSTEDYYMYIKTKEQKGNFIRLNNCSIFFILPKNIIDHINQSNRFLSLHNNFIEILDKESIKKYGTLSLTLKIKIIKTMLLKNFFLTILYIPILITSKIYSIFSPAKNSLWKISQSTKDN